MTFALPQILWLLVLVPALASFLVWAWRKREVLIAQFVQSRLLAELTVGVSKPRQKVRLALLVISVVLLILAMARPQWGFKWEEAKQRGLDIVVAIDASRSMLARDIKPNRLERSKLAALDLMKLARTDRLGLIAFAGTAFLQCPLTLDDEAFRQSISVVNPDIMPQGGTALAETIMTALSAFKNEGDNYRILVLFTDGEDHEEGVLEAAELAAKEGMRIFTIGIGSPQGELIPIGSGSGGAQYLKDDSGNVVKSRLNEELLQQIAGAAKGFYLNLSGADTIETLYARGLAPLPKGEYTARMVRRYFERFYWPLTLAIVLLLIEMFLPERRRRRKKATTDAGSAPVVAMLALVLMLASAGPVRGSSKTAYEQFKKGQYEEALEEYRKLRDASPDDYRLHFNAGAAAFRARQFDEAARNFSAAIATEDESLQQRSWYNLGNTVFNQGEAAPSPDKKSEAWKNALKLYEKAIEMNAEDADAKHNRDFVKYRLEELEKQQEQQKQEQKSDENEDKKDDDKDKQKGDEDKKDDKKDPQDKSDEGKKDDKKDESKQEQKPDSKDQAKKPDSKGDEQKKPSPPEKSDEKDKGDPGKSPPPQPSPTPLGQMSPEQAKQLLDSQKGEERALIFQPPQTNRVDKRFLKKW